MNSRARSGQRRADLVVSPFPHVNITEVRRCDVKKDFLPAWLCSLSDVPDQPSRPYGPGGNPKNIYRSAHHEDLSDHDQWTIEGCVETQPRDQPGTRPRADLVAPLRRDITTVSDRDHDPSMPPTDHHMDHLPGQLHEGLRASASQLITALGATKQRHQAESPTPVSPSHGDQRHPMEPAQATNVDNVGAGGAYRVAVDAFGLHFITASALDGLIEAIDNSTERAEHGNQQPQP
jgi:hypothetical protein